MDNFKKFIISVSGHIVATALVLVTFLALFILNKLEFDVYILGLEISIFVLIVYLIIRFIGFNKDNSYEEKITMLEEENLNLKNLNRQQKNEILEYFMMWVHQIKTPITAANLLINLNEVDKNQVTKQLFYIEDYTNMALSYLKINEYERDMVFDDVKVDDIIKPILRKYSLIFIDNRISLDYKSIEEKITTDAKWLGILLEQIISNAAKYTKNGTVSIKLFKTEDENIIEIKDTGIGISEQDLPKIFDRGYSGFNGRMNQKSSGIGLFLAKQIANKILADIEVESTVGEGTTFYVRLKNKHL